MPAPKNPWIARQRIICSIVEANPHRKLAMVKPEAEIANSNLVPSARDRNPDNGIAITSAIRYEVWTHDTSVELADRPAWISLSDAETTWMSRIDMNIPNTMMRNANSRRGSMRSEGAAAAFIIEGGAVVASAMICSGQDMHLDRARRLIRNIIAGGSSSASRGRLRCRHRWRRWYRRWCKLTCPRAAGSVSRRPSARAREPEAAARSW